MTRTRVRSVFPNAQSRAWFWFGERATEVRSAGLSTRYGPRSKTTFIVTSHSVGGVALTNSTFGTFPVTKGRSSTSSSISKTRALVGKLSLFPSGMAGQANLPQYERIRRW